MKKNIKIFKIMMVAAVLLTCATQLYAQGPTLPDDPEGTTPIDGGLSLLVAAGVGYGAKKMKERKAKMANLDKG